MEFIDLKAQRARIEKEINTALDSVIEHGRYIMGPEVAELEKELARYVGVKECVTCASGTDALVIALMALGIKTGDAVLVPSLTFVATAEVVSLLGATPVFVDVDRESFNMCPQSLIKTLEELNSGKNQANSGSKNLRPRAVIPVDLYGLPANYAEINAIAAENDLVVIEDAAQGFGASVGNCRAGDLSPIGCTSFFPAKPLGCYGDGGALFTNDVEQADAWRSIRVHGKGSHKYDTVRTGINSRLDTLQAAILLAKFKIFPDEVSRRQEVASRYEKKLEGIVEGIVKTPVVPEGMTSAWAQYTILVDHRDDVASVLKQQGIPTVVYYPKPLHLQPIYANLGYGPGDLPVCEDLCGRILCLPMHPYLDEQTQNVICTSLAEAVERATQ